MADPKAMDVDTDAGSKPTVAKPDGQQQVVKYD